jgi:hypothetical protein
MPIAPDLPFHHQDPPKVRVRSAPLLIFGANAASIACRVRSSSTGNRCEYVFKVIAALLCPRRSVNGVVSAHSAGDEVTVANPSVYSK